MISDLEKKILEKLYKEYKNTGKRIKWKVTDAFNELGIQDGMNVSVLNDSKYVGMVSENTYDYFMITEEGIRFMDQQNSDDLTTKTDEELEAIIRRAENTNIPGSRYQKAKIELELRDRRVGKGNQEMIKLKPEFYGVRLDLKIIWQKLKSLFKN